MNLPDFEKNEDLSDENLSGEIITDKFVEDLNTDLKTASFFEDIPQDLPESDDASNGSDNKPESHSLIDDVEPEKRSIFAKLRFKRAGRPESQLPDTFTDIAPIIAPTAPITPAVPTATTATTAPPPAQKTKDTPQLADEYHFCLAQAQKIDFEEEKKLGFLYKAGIDSLGRPVVVFVAAFLPGKSINPDRLLLYVLKEMDPIVVRDYTLVYVHSYFSSQNRYKKNLKSLYIIHPTFWIKTTFKLFKPFISTKFWQKLVYIEDVNDLFKYIHRDQLTLPNIVYQYGAESGKIQPIFGVPLAEVMKRNDHAHAEVPIVVEKSVKYLIEKKGSSVAVQQLRKEFDKGDNPSLDNVEDPNVIASLLKLYFRELPEPLFPFEMYDRLVNSYVTNKNNFLPSLKEILVELPPPNKALLRYLLEMLSYIEKNSQANKMNSSNLSIVFAPNLIRSPKESIQQAVMHAPIVNSVMRSIIDNYTNVLPTLTNDKTM